MTARPAPDSRYESLHRLASAAVEAFDGAVEPNETLGGWADQLTAAMDALRAVVGTPENLSWPCVHCGRDCKGPHAFGVHLTGRQARLQSCDGDEIGQPYGLRAHAAGTVASHCNCAGLA